MTYFGEFLSAKDLRPRLCSCPKYANSNASVVRIAIPNDTDAINFEDIYGPMPGLMMEMTMLICQSLRLNCVFQLVPTNGYGRLENGSWTGILGLIDNKTFDTSIPAFTMTEERSVQFSFANHQIYLHRKFVIREPIFDPDKKLSAVIDPLENETWGLVIVCISVISFLVTTASVTLNLTHSSFGFKLTYWCEVFGTEMR